jgi:long-chain acyl-CoA synthetase
MADTIPARLFDGAASRGDRPAYYLKQDGEWRPTSWRTYADEVRAAGKALMALGFAPGDAVALLGFNRPEWVILDLAAMAVGGAAAGIYTTSSAEEVAYVIGHAEARVVLVENQAQLAKVQQVKAELPRLETIVAMKAAGRLDGALAWDDFLARGAGVSDADFDALLRALEPGGLATLIYTSGTTGPPKGVMLSHDNLVWTATTLADELGNSEGETSLSYLPLSHIAEQMSTIHGPIVAGGAVYFAQSLETVADDLREVQPTIFFGVPRIWEKFHAVVAGKLGQATGFKKRLVDWVRRVGRRRNARLDRGERVGLRLELQHRAADKLVLSKLKPALGLGKARLCVSGAAPISKEILEFFASLDVPVREVYGQSEDTGPTSMNLPGRTRLGTVGRPLAGVEVKIAPDDEILVRGRNVFLGYYKDPAATAECLIDGWMHSGDLGKLDADGYLHITGRKKDIIITAGGKNIAPKNLEAALKNHALVNEAVVIGDRRKYLTALVTLDEEAARAFQAERGGAGPLDQEPAIQAEVQRAVDQLNATLAQVETIKKFTILPRNLTIDQGELTPTLKVKRKAVHDNFAAQIEAMYA